MHIRSWISSRLRTKRHRSGKVTKNKPVNPKFVENQADIQSQFDVENPANFSSESDTEFDPPVHFF